MLQINLPGNKVSRKKFLKRISLIFLLPLFWLWNSTVKQSILRFNEANIIFIPADLSEGVQFFDKVVAIKTNNKIKIFSTACTHLGCKIKDFEKNKFTCPCHGSVFNINGQVEKGPASKPLKLLSFEFTHDKKQIKILNA
jgi:Rieske Fe-S protein